MVGQRVQLSGLVQNTNYNGQRGRVERYIEQRKKWSIRLDDGTVVAVTKDKLCIGPEAEDDGSGRTVDNDLSM